jgi:chromosome partitioning protein
MHPYNPQLKFLGVLANRFNPHFVRQKEALQQLITHYNEFMVPTKISTRSEALAAGIPVWQLAKSSARDASAEVLQAFELLRKRMSEQAEASMEGANAAA